jgi:hypothetical protein
MIHVNGFSRRDHLLSDTIPYVDGVSLVATYLLSRSAAPQPAISRGAFWRHP